MIRTVLEEEKRRDDKEWCLRRKRGKKRKEKTEEGALVLFIWGPHFLGKGIRFGQVSGQVEQGKLRWGVPKVRGVWRELRKGKAVKRANQLPRLNCSIARYGTTTRNEQGPVPGRRPPGKKWGCGPRKSSRPVSRAV